MREHAEMRDDDSTTRSTGHETRDISTRVVSIFAATLVVAAILIHLFVWLVFGFYGSLNARAYPRNFPLAQVGAPQQPPAPRLQSQPREELKAMRADEERYLHSYGWIDPSGGVAHIPIERAMQLLLQQGLPARPAPEGVEPEGRPQRSSSGRTMARED